MDTLFTTSKNSKTCKPHRLLLNVGNKIHIEISNIYVAI